MDDFYHTDSPGYSLNRANIKERIAELDAIYKEWQFHLWNFSSNRTECNEIWNDCQNSIDLMASSANCYILAMFVPSIQASSAAVEKLVNVIVYLEKRNKLKLRKNDTDEVIHSPADKWIKVDTVEQPQYYSKNFRARFFKRGDGFVEFYYPELTCGLTQIPALPYHPELICKSDPPDESAFVQRRNAAAHGVMTRLLLIEQVHGYVIDKDEDWWPLINNKHSAFEQYRSASDFMIDTFKVFTEEYGHSD